MTVKEFINTLLYADKQFRIVIYPINKLNLNTEWLGLAVVNTNKLINCEEQYKECLNSEIEGYRRSILGDFKIELPEYTADDILNAKVSRIISSATNVIGLEIESIIIG